MSSSVIADVPQVYCCNHVTSLSQWHQVYIKNFIAKAFCPLSPFWFCFCPPRCALGHWHLRGTGPCRQAANLPPSSGRARAGRGTAILAEQRKPGVRYASCGKGRLGRNALQKGADLPALRRLGSSFPRGVEGGGGGGEPTPTQKYPPKKSSLLVPVLEGGLQGAATCSTLGQNLLVPVLERGLHGAATRSTPGQGPKRCPQPRVPPGHPNRGTTRSASPAAALRAVIPSRQDPERGEEEEAMDQSRRHSFRYLLLPEAREVQIGRSPAASIA